MNQDSLSDVTSSSFIHTSSFSLPIEQKKNIKKDLELNSSLLETALTSSSKLAEENLVLQSQIKALEDQILLLKEISLVKDDPSFVDITISALRGKLLENSRIENDNLKKEIIDLKRKNKSLEGSIEYIQAQYQNLQLESETSIKKLDEVTALSEARGRAIEKLDTELIKSRQELNNLVHEKSELIQVVSQNDQSNSALAKESSNIKEELQRERERNDRLTEKLLNQNLDLRVTRAGTKNDVSKISSIMSSSPIQQPLDLEKEREEFKRIESELTRENMLLRKELEMKGPLNLQSNGKIILSLRNALSEAISELKEMNESQVKERKYYNSYLAAQEAKYQDALDKLKNISKYKKHIKVLKFLLKKTQAEYVAFVARTRSSTSVTF